MSIGIGFRLVASSMWLLVIGLIAFITLPVLHHPLAAMFLIPIFGAVLWLAVGGIRSVWSKGF